MDNKIEIWYNVHTGKMIKTIRREWVQKNPAIEVFILEDGSRWEISLFLKNHRKDGVDINKEMFLKY